NAQPLPRVTAQLTDALTAFSQLDGSYALPNVPYGSYILKAQLVQPDGTFLSASIPLSIKATQVQQDVALQLPPAEFRQIVVTGQNPLPWTPGRLVQTNADPD